MKRSFNSSLEGYSVPSQSRPPGPKQPSQHPAVKSALDAIVASLRAKLQLHTGYSSERRRNASIELHGQILQSFSRSDWISKTWLKTHSEPTENPPPLTVRQHRFNLPWLTTVSVLETTECFPQCHYPPTVVLNNNGPCLVVDLLCCPLATCRVREDEFLLP